MKEFKPGHLYQINEQHRHWGDRKVRNYVFLCTKMMYASYGPIPDDTVKSHVLINVTDGGFWTDEPDPKEFKEMKL